MHLSVNQVITIFLLELYFCRNVSRYFFKGIPCPKVGSDQELATTVCLFILLLFIVCPNIILKLVVKVHALDITIYFQVMCCNEEQGYSKHVCDFFLTNFCVKLK